MKFLVFGADSKTGIDSVLEIEATSDKDAADQARQRGIFVSNITQKRSRKFVLIIASGVALGLAIALGIVLLIVAIVIPAMNKSKLGPAETKFLEDVKSRRTEIVQQELAEQLEWKDVVTPALSSALITTDYYYNMELDSEYLFWKSFCDRMVANGADVNACMLKADRIRSINYLLGKGANIDAVDERRQTLLLIYAGTALQDIFAEQVSFLIAKGANINAIDVDGNTPLHEAAKSGSTKIMMRLLAAGANLNAKNRNGQTPLALARLCLQPNAIKILETKGGKE